MRAADFQRQSFSIARASGIREATLGASHINTGTSLNNLAVLYLSQKKPVEAASLFERALKITKRDWVAHPETARNLNNLASVYCAQGKYSEAESLWKQGIGQSLKGHSALKVLELAAPLDQLADCYRSTETPGSC